MKGGAMATFVGGWSASTAGERLLHFLATRVDGLRDLEVARAVGEAGVSRAVSFGHFINNCLVLHCFGRVLQVAKHLRAMHENAADARENLESYLLEFLDISRGSCLNFNQLAPLALEAAAHSSETTRRIRSSVKQEVLKPYRGTFACYSCNGSLSADAPAMLSAAPGERDQPNPAFLDFDHVWPHSYGGDSTAENLLPCCQFCNKAKGNMTSWEWVALQAVLPETSFNVPQLEDRLTTKEEKIALHMRAAFEYARTYGTTLKDAYVAIGPRSSHVMLVDTMDTPDFFNLRVHDEASAGVVWRSK